jgi:hypothetical protein
MRGQVSGFLKKRRGEKGEPKPEAKKCTIGKLYVSEIKRILDLNKFVVCSLYEYDYRFPKDIKTQRVSEIS